MKAGIDFSFGVELLIYTVCYVSITVLYLGHNRGVML